MAENGIETAKEGTSIPEPENGYQNEREVMKNELKDSVVSESTRKQTTPKAAKDELDSASVYSLFMEKDARYYFQHPYCRILVAYVVTFCNFLIYAEDPMAHSMKESSVPVIGNDFSFIFTKYSPNAWSLLKVILWIAAIFTGLVLGKLLFHQMLFKNCFKLKMFQNDQGSWMTMFFTAILCLFIFSYLYNLFLIIGGEATDVYKVSSAMGISNSYFMKGAACGTWCGDFFTAWMVTDIVLQEKLYPDWAKGLRIWWKRKYNRIILFWIVLSITSFVVLFVIATDYINWDKLNHGFLPSNEFSRAFGASIILVLDLIIVMQKALAFPTMHCTAIFLDVNAFFLFLNNWIVRYWQKTALAYYTGQQN